MHILKKYLQYTVVILLATLILLFSSRNWLIEMGTPLLLQRAGFQDIGINGVSLDSTSCFLQGFTLTIPLASGAIKAAAQDIHVNFTLKALIEGRVNSLIIDSLDFTRIAPPSKTVQGKAFTVDRLPNLLQALADQKFPVDAVEIKHLRLHTAELGPFSGKPLKAIVQETDSGLQANIDYQAGPNAVYQLEGVLHDNGTTHLRLYLQEDDVSPLAVELALTKKQITGHIECILDRLDLIQPFIILPLPELQGKLAADFSLDMIPSSQALKIALTGKHLQYRDIQARDLQLNLNLSELPTGPNLVLEPSSRLAASALIIRGLHAEHLDIDLAGRLQHQDNQYHISFTPVRPWQFNAVQGSDFEVALLNISPPESILTQEAGMQIRTDSSFGITAKHISYKQYNLPELTLTPAEKNTATVITFNEQGWVARTGNWQTGEATLNQGEISLQSSPLQIDLKKIQTSTSGLSAVLDFSTDALLLTARERQLQFENMAGHLQWGDSRINGELSWELEDNPGTLQALISHDLHKRSGTATLKANPELELHGDSRILSGLLNPLQLPVTLKTGALALQARARWSASGPMHLETDILLSQGVGAIKGLPFSDLAIKHNLQVLPQLKSLDQGEISVARINGPVTIEDLGLQVAISPSNNEDKPSLTLQNMGCRLLGGTLKIDALTYDFNQADAAFTVQLLGLNLPELMTVQQVKGLAISGKVDGTLPVAFNKGRLSIDNGRVHNGPGGGTIHYRPPDGYTEDSPLTGFALKALEEFHYHQLRAELTYNPDGNLIVTMHLQGKSPKLETSRPVHLNITTEQNLLSLLQSLKYSKSLTDELDTQVQEHYRKPSAN